MVAIQIGAEHLAPLRQLIIKDTVSPGIKPGESPMALHTPPVEEFHDAYVVAQLHPK